MKNSIKDIVPVSSGVKINRELNKYSNVVLFPEKVEKARKAFEKLGVPDLNKIDSR